MPSYPVQVRKGSAAAIEGSVAYSQTSTSSCGGAEEGSITETGNAQSFYLPENDPSPPTSSATFDSFLILK